MGGLCKALKRITYNDHPFTAKCTRFAGHEDHPSGKYRRHFDHYRKISWEPTPRYQPRDSAEDDD